MCLSWNGITITTSKVVQPNNLSIIEKYIYGLEEIDAENNLTPYLPQLKSFLKILGISYFGNNSSNSINSVQIKSVLSHTDIFQDIILSFWPYIVRVFPRSDMVIVWINIWDSQNGTKAKSLINRSFNIDCHVVTI